MKIINLFLGLLLMTSCSLLGIQDEEGPQYSVIEKDNNIEIRKYKPYIIAETEVEGSYDESSSKAFRRLAGYIFGKNKKKTKIKMTAPVMQKAGIEPTNEKIPMTSPVYRQKVNNKWTMSFVMPSRYKSIDELPTPLEEGIAFKVIPEKIVAAIRFSGSRDEAANDKKTQELQQWLEKNKKYKATSKVYSAGYNPPWTLPAMRRNEMMFEVSLQDK